MFLNPAIMTVFETVAGDLEACVSMVDGDELWLVDLDPINKAVMDTLVKAANGSYEGTPEPFQSGVVGKTVYHYR